MAVCHGDKHSEIEYWYSGEKVLRFTKGRCVWLRLLQSHNGEQHGASSDSSSTVSVPTKTKHQVPVKFCTKCKYSHSFSLGNLSLIYITVIRFEVNCHDLMCKRWRILWQVLFTVDDYFAPWGWHSQSEQKIVRILKCLPHSMYW